MGYLYLSAYFEKKQRRRRRRMEMAANFISTERIGHNFESRSAHSAFSTATLAGNQSS